jgi:hypothetical protein
MIDSFTSTLMHESCQVIRDETSPVTEQPSIEVPEDENDDTIQSQRQEKPNEEDEDLAIVPVTKNTCGTQTKVRMRDLRMMISLTDISEGWAAILVFNARHNSYCVLSTNNSLYFVKQRSLRSIGIEQNVHPAKQTLLFARIVSVELCETKKAPNRYNLPPNTRFYRVDVGPLPLVTPMSLCNETRSVTADSSKTV